ncbi:unnamed protein product, partial [Amoebophrya sp. A120]
MTDNFHEILHPATTPAHLFKDPDILFQDFQAKREVKIFVCAPVEDFVNEVLSLLRNRWLLQGFIGLIFHDNFDVDHRRTSSTTSSRDHETNPNGNDPDPGDGENQNQNDGSHGEIPTDRNFFLHTLHRFQQMSLPSQFAMLVPRWTSFLEHPVEQSIEEIAKKRKLFYSSVMLDDKTDTTTTSGGSTSTRNHIRRRIREASLGLGTTCSLFQAAAIAEGVVSVGLGIEPELVYQAENIGRDQWDEYVPTLRSRVEVLVTKYVLEGYQTPAPAKEQEDENTQSTSE